MIKLSDIIKGVERGRFVVGDSFSVEPGAVYAHVTGYKIKSDGIYAIVEGANYSTKVIDRSLINCLFSKDIEFITFTEALQAVFGGNCVKHKGWPDGCYLQQLNGVIYSNVDESIEIYQINHISNEKEWYIIE